MELGRIVNHYPEKAEVFSNKFCSVFGWKTDNVVIAHDDDDDDNNEILFIPIVTQENVRPQLLKLYIFKSAGPDNLLQIVFKELVEELSGLLMLIFNKLLEHWDSSKRLKET